MKVLILGGGRVGGSLARELVDNNYDVSVVDLDKGALSNLEENLDIMTVEGHAAHPLSIKKAGADDTTTVIAVTSNDEVNLIACQVAKKEFGVKQTICRLTEGSYSEKSITSSPSSSVVVSVKTYSTRVLTAKKSISPIKKYTKLPYPQLLLVSLIL